MYKKFRKTAAVILTAAMLLQSGIQGMAEETQAVAAAETQVPTEAPQTEAPTEAPQTQAPTEAPQTQAPTEAPQTQAPTEAPQTQAPTETDESETESSKRSDRKNDGEKVTANDLVSKLGEALDYLFVADTVEAPENLLEGQEILQDGSAGSVLGSLARLSVTLADARSSKDVEVINLYADEDGHLDTAQLDEAYSDHVIDVTDKYFVVNVIADSANQDLSFSGYDMKLSGNTVQYKEETQPGDILYNFAALDGDKYTDYKGTLTLKRGAGLQGTFLAPKADVHIGSALAGSVFADSVKVADTVESLMQIGFIDGIQPQKEEGQGETESGSTSEETGSDNTSESTSAETGDGTTDLGQSDGQTQEESVPESTGAEDGPELNDPGDEVETGTIELTVTPKDAAGNPVTIDTWQNTSFVLEYTADESTEYVKDSNGDVRVFEYKGAALPIKGLSIGVAYTLVQLSAEVGYQPADNITITLTKTDSLVPAVVENMAVLANSKSITVNVSASYNDVKINAAVDKVNTGKYVALFKKENGETEPAETTLTRVGSVRELIYLQDQNVASAVFDGLTPGDYKLQSVDILGNLLPEETDNGLKLPENDITVTEESDPQPVDGTLDFASYPEGKFYYLGTVKVAKSLLDKDNNPMTSAIPFYANLYTDSSKGTPVTTTGPVFTFDLKGSNEATATYEVKPTSEVATYYLAETDAGGKIVASGSDFGYEITIPQDRLTIYCDKENAEATATITNKALSSEPQPDPTVVRIGVKDKSTGKYISGVKILIKDSSGKLVLGKTYKSGSAIAKLSDADVQKLTPGETYYLSEVSAPSGYAPAKDVQFTITEHQTTDAVLVHSGVSSTSYQLTVSKQVYVGDCQVYANGTSNNHNFNVALFEDKNHLVKVSDVQQITVKGLTGSTTFKNLKNNGTYYVAETDANGIPKASSGTVTIQYENSGEVKISSENNSTIVKNVYSTLPSGYRYTAVLTLTKKVVDTSGSGEAATSTFYAGIYRQSDYSDTPTIVKFEMNNKSSASVKRRILLPGKTDSAYTSVTYYIAEVDSTGKRLTESSDFDYNISISSAEVTLGKGDSKTVTITNEKKVSSKVTLYLTKRVYEGSASKKVTETFYAGLFKDSSFTQPYTKPIPLSLKDKSEMTLKLSLNLGKATEATIYVAEVDANGKVITDQQGFGYEIKMVNSTAAFTKDIREVRAVLLNSVYGTSSRDDWQNIVDHNDWGNSSAVSGNGEPSAGTAAPQTGDSTPVGWYLLLMAAAFAVFTGTVYRRKKQ